MSADEAPAQDLCIAPGEAPALLGVEPALAREERPSSPEGCFVRFTPSESSSRHVVGLGKVAGLTKFTACHRYEPFWMRPYAGKAEREVPQETQYLLCQLAEGHYLLLVPLIDGPNRAALAGGRAGLELVIETQDPNVPVTPGSVLFVARGDEPYALLERSAATIAARLGLGKLRRDRSLPSFADRFGWCTWDAFYQEVSHDKVREGLESFQSAGISPKFLILDDGWQSTRRLASGEQRLTGFTANAKFDGDLARTVRLAKSEHGVETFLVWHAVVGYWGGVDGEALPGYGARDTLRWFGPGVLSHFPKGNQDFWGPVVGMVPPDAIERFYRDYHAYLRTQDVDGVKVDNQGVLEGVSHGFGGRVAVNRAYRLGLEASSLEHFGGNVINCMSNAQETLFGLTHTSLLRTSTDFWPNTPSSHGHHLYCNAQVGAFFGEFCHPDWDMFQSGHPAGAFHAAGRAVSGSPVYVSDKPGGHDANVLKKLVLSDGGVLRASGVGKPTVDCLFSDPTRERVLLKIWNSNPVGGVIGVFNARYDEGPGGNRAISGDVSPSDVVGLAGEEFAVYSHVGRSMVACARTRRLSVKLPQLGFEIYTIVPISRGVAAIGLADKFNGGGAVREAGWRTEVRYEALFRAGGEILLYCERRPARVLIDDKPVQFRFESRSGKLSIAFESAGALRVGVEFAAEEEQRVAA